MSLLEKLAKYLKELKDLVHEMHEKRQEIFINWLNRHNKYLRDEVTFTPTRQNTFKRGDVIYIDFGFNVGKEYGGLHWAVVVQNDNKSAHTLVVVPLSSVKEGRTIHPNDADLGIIDGLNNKRAMGLLAQITTVSKMRIQIGRRYRLTSEQLDEIDKKIIKRFVNPKIYEKLY